MPHRNELPQQGVQIRAFFARGGGQRGAGREGSEPGTEVGQNGLDRLAREGSSGFGRARLLPSRE